MDGVGGVGGGAISNDLELEINFSYANNNTDNVENSLPEEAPLEVDSPPPPPVPVKKTSGGKRVIIPDEDVVFELEDVPMPETPQKTSLLEDSKSVLLLHDEDREPSLSLQTEVSPLPPSILPVPGLPPKEDTSTTCTSLPTLTPTDMNTPSESSQIPILLPRETEVSPVYPSVPLLPPEDEEVSPQSSSVPPALPSKEIDVLSVEVSELTVAAEEQPPFSVLTTERPDFQPELATPPLPARRHFAAEIKSADSQIASTRTPPLPRRDTGPPSFSPPPPPIANLEDEGEAEVPPQPPPRTSTLPPSALRNGGNEEDSEEEDLSPPMVLASMPELTAQREPASDSFAASHQIRSVWNDNEDDDIIPVVGLESLAPPTTNSDERSSGELTPEYNLGASLGEAELNLIVDGAFSPPVLPPKEHQRHPPPPPPITPDDFPEDFSTSDMSDSDEDSRPLMSIQSTRNQQDDDRMMLAHAPPPSSNGGTFYNEDDSYNTTPSSSAESTPKKKTLIRQSGSSLQRGFTDDDIMVVSPKPPMDSDDYMNQEAIDMVAQDADDDIIMVTPKPMSLAEVSEDYMNQEAIDRANQDTDYMNQDAIDQTMADEDDVNATNIEREHFVIRGSSPIKSRTLEVKQRANVDRDYENQDVVDEVLEGDIIPVGTIPSPEGDIIPVGHIPSPAGDIIPVGHIPSPDGDIIPVGPPVPSPEAPISKNSPQPATRRDYAYSVSVAGPGAKQKVKRHRYEEMDPISPTRSNTVCFDGKRWIFRNEEGSGPTSLPVTDSGSKISSTQGDCPVPREDDIEITSPLESSTGSINQTFPRTASTVSSQYKPPLPERGQGQEQLPSSSSNRRSMKHRSHSMEDTTEVDGGGVSASAPNRSQGGYNDVSVVAR